MPNGQVIAFTTFIASEAFLADKSSADKALSYLRKCEGALSLYYGFQTEAPRRFYVFIVWETSEAIDKTLMKPDYPRFLMIFNKLIEAGDCTWQHIDFDEDPANALGAPITELAIGILKIGHAQEELDSAVLRMKSKSTLNSGVYAPIAYGRVRRTSEFVLVIGWDNVQTHLNAIQMPPAKPLATKLSNISDLVVNHVALRKI